VGAEAAAGKEVEIEVTLGAFPEGLENFGL
jgi:hypothetical protein